jgi:hypothetical protein
MNLEIRSFADAGDVSKERIVLKALADLDVGEYAVFRSGISTDGALPTSGRKMAYWFPDEKVKANDLIVLYTKEGSRSSKRLDNGTTAYFFYWGRKESLWGSNEHGAVVLEILDWAFRVAGK